jgi:serine/threonine protein kinase
MIDEFIGIILAGKYEVEELLRESDLGNIYRGKHLLMEKPVTIKILSPTLAVDKSIVERFSLEARTISRLSHPNILNVTDFGTNDGIVFIVMEDTEGTNLKELVKNEGAFDIERTVRIARQIAAALSSAHASGIVHRHLTSEKILINKMVNDTDLVKVLDVGSFDIREERDFEEESLEDLAYLSPEQCSEESEPDERSDIYSLGIIFYEMLTGEVPFTADTPLDLMLKHSQVPPPPLAAFREDIPEEVEEIIIRALAKNPDMRYQNVAALAEDLGDALNDSEDDGTLVIPKVAAVGADKQNNLWKTAFILLAGISIVAFAMIYVTNMKQTDPATEYQVDADGKPVQPLNPATGINEKNVSMTDFNDPTLNTEGADGMIPDVGGDGYDPWNGSGLPPGAPPSAPLGQPIGTVTIPPGGSDSPFAGQEPYGYDKDGNPIYLIPVPKSDVSPQPEEKTSAGDETKKKPEDNPKSPAKDGTKTDPDKKPETKPAEKPPAKETKPKTPPSEKPAEKKSPPSTRKRNIKSGVEQDTMDKL